MRSSRSLELPCGGRLGGVKWGRLAVLLVAGAGSGLAHGALGTLAGCSSPQALLGTGGQCLQTTDCQDGLVCVQRTPNGDKTCTTDLTNIVSTEEAGMADAPVRDGNAEGGGTREGGRPDGGGGADATQPADTGALLDTSQPTDAGADAGD
jgi:hypothetical protein